MSLLTLCQAVAKDAGFAVPNTIVGNTDDTAAMLLALANKSGKNLAGYAWQALQKEYDFSTVASTATYALPSDYGFIQNDTVWDRTNLWDIRGSLSAEEWQVYKSGITSATPRSRFRIKQNLIYIDPTPSAVVAVAMEYVSNAWAWDGAATYADNFVTDAYVPLIDDYLIELDVTWRFLERKGLAYAEAKAEAEDEIWYALGVDEPKNTTNLAGQQLPWPPLPTLPSTGYS